MKHYGKIGTGEYYTRVYVYRQCTDEAMLIAKRPRRGWPPEGCVDVFHSGGLGTGIEEIEEAEDYLVDTGILERCENFGGMEALWFV